MKNNVPVKGCKENSGQSQEIFDNEPSSLEEIILERLKEASPAFDDAESLLKYLKA